MILLDIVMALSIAALIASGMTAATLEAQETFDHAKTRSDLIRIYRAHSSEFSSLMPYGSYAASYPYASTSEQIRIDATARWYGNDRIETDTTLSFRNESIEFAAVRAYPFADIADAAGASLCSPDISSGNKIGSYPYFHQATTSVAIDIVPITLPIDPLLPLTDMEVRGSTAYVSADSSTASDPDLIIADISDVRNPRILSILNTGPGIAKIELAGRRIFAAAASTAAELHVIRLDSLSSPVLARKYRLPLPEASTTPPSGTAIAYDRGKIYLGTDKWDGDEFSVIDVSIPENPVKISGLETGSKVNDIVVRDGVAYIAASDQMQLRAVDIADPARPFLTGSFSPSGWARQEGKSLAYFEDSLDWGRTSGGFDIPADHEWFHWRVPSSTPRISESPVSMNIPGGTYGSVSDRRNVYAVTRTPDKELMILDRSLSASTAVYYPLPVAPQTIACDGPRLYILAHTAPVIYEITKLQP